MTYRITAQGAGGTTEATARVTVNPRPTQPAPPGSGRPDDVGMKQKCLK